MCALKCLCEYDVNAYSLHVNAHSFLFHTYKFAYFIFLNVLCILYVGIALSECTFLLLVLSLQLYDCIFIEVPLEMVYCRKHALTN